MFREEMTNRYQEHLLVIGQSLGIVLCIYPGTIMHGGEYRYLIISLLGLIGGGVTLFYNKIGNFNIYPQVKTDGKLITSGPYTQVRHPMYLFLILIMLGITLFNFQIRTLGGFILIVICLSAKILKEEDNLNKKFSGYREYMRRTKRIIPWVW